MDIKFIEQRIKTLKSHKADLLRLKKKERGNKTKDIESRIARLTKWKRQLIGQQTRRNIKKATEKFVKSTNECGKAFESLQKSLAGLTPCTEEASGRMGGLGSLKSVFQQVRSEEIQETIEKR